MFEGLPLVVDSEFEDELTDCKVSAAEDSRDDATSRSIQMLSIYNLTQMQQWCINDTMIRTQVQFLDPLYKRLQDIAEQQDCSLSEVMRKAAEHFVDRFPPCPEVEDPWQFPVLDCGGDFLRDPAILSCEAEAIEERN